MILVRPPGPFDERLLPLLAEWLPARRWFPAKGVEAVTSLVGAVPLDDPGADGADQAVRIVLVRVRAGSIEVTLQVPLVLRRRSPGLAEGTTLTAVASRGAAVPDAAAASEIVGILPDGSGSWLVLDGAAHPAFVRAWLAVADGPGADLDPATARAVAGEQSNTSVIVRGPGEGGILKVLRALAPGENPDVDVPRHLVDVGWASVPRPLAWLEAQWPAVDDTLVRGYLGAMSVFVDAAEDGFELACTFARRGESFAAQARQLGEVVAGMHDALVRAYGTDPDHVGAQGPAEVARSLSQRFAWAVSAVPTLASYRTGVESVVSQVSALPVTPARQRVHGDLHLGQVLRSHGRWFVTDFEGEPLAPLELRTRADLAVRDVAGLLRSFDYAAAVGGLTGEPAAVWADSARTSLLAGYHGTMPPDRPADTPATAGRSTGSGSRRIESALLRALELDKALYEVVYESRNRPTWVGIPLAGLDRLVGAPFAEAPEPA
ncbi:maltokinase N-terminal cap-like domain-containing protein [Cellulomonas soli]|uniref:maltokinase N-terminal cap-like domain-containing protein n=1 Tax=Cellulomonas soli TaxID=931535 RepID=UPI003F859B13